MVHFRILPPFYPIPATEKPGFFVKFFLTILKQGFLHPSLLPPLTEKPGCAHSLILPLNYLKNPVSCPLTLVIILKKIHETFSYLNLYPHLRCTNANI